MSHPPKKKREIFLLSRLKLQDYLLIVGVILLIPLLYAIFQKGLDTLNTVDAALTALEPPPQWVPARSIQAAHNLSPLWNKEEFFMGDTPFFTIGEKTLLYPAASKSHDSNIYFDTHTLEAIDIATSQIQWQADIPVPASIGIYNDKVFVLSQEWLDQAPTSTNQEFPNCSFIRKMYSLSAYDLHTGQKEWGYGYQGVNGNSMYFVNQSVFLTGTGMHGTRHISVKIDKNSGFIVDQNCNGLRSSLYSEGISNPPPSEGDFGSSFTAGALDDVDESYRFGCQRGYHLCFLTKGNRLHVRDRDSRKDIAVLDFEGPELTNYYSEIVVQGNIIVVHFVDSHQIFAFRLP